MSENLFKLFTTEFSTNLEMKLQQAGSKLRGRVREGQHVGKQALRRLEIALGVMQRSFAQAALQGSRCGFVFL